MVERHLIFAYMAAAPQNKFFKAQTLFVPGDPFVPKMVAVKAEESCGFAVEKRPPDP